MVKKGSRCRDVKGIESGKSFREDRVRQRLQGGEPEGEEPEGDGEVGV